MFGIYGDNDPVSIKGTYYQILKDALADEGFVPVDDGKKGTHSVRKCACDMGRGNGLTRDDLDYRAQWKSDRRQQDEYTGTTMLVPHVDGKAAFSLCKRGAVAYM